MVCSDIAGLHCTVEVASQTCKEYVDDHESLSDGAGKTLRYIEAIPGCRFQIRLSLGKDCRHQENDFITTTYIDGVCVRNVLWLKNQRYKETAYSGVYHHVHSSTLTASGGNYQEQDFYFSDLKLAGNGPKTALHSMDLQSLGTIRVTVHRVKDLVPKTDDSCLHGGRTLTSRFTDGVSEKLLKGKAISSCTSFGDVRMAPKTTFWKSTYIDPVSKPLAEFTFRYRTLADLKAMMIFSRSPSPESPELVPLERRRLCDLTAAERKLLIEQEAGRMGIVKAEGSRIRGTKREHDSATSAARNFQDDDELSIVKEQPIKRRKPDEEADIIDLTAD